MTVSRDGGTPHMSEPCPRLSVVMGVYGRVEALETTLKTVFAQTVQDLEIVLVDDGNEGHDRLTLQRLAQSDARIQLLRNDRNVGLTASLVKGCAAARAPFIARIDNGDLMVPSTRLETQLALLEQNPRLAVVGGGVEFVDCLNAHRYRSPLVHKAHAEIVRQSSNWFSHVTVMMRKSAYEACGGYDPAWRVGQDSELWPRLLQHGEGLNLPEVFAIAPIHRGSISVARNNEQILGKIRRIRDTKSAERTLFKLMSTSGRIAFELVKLMLPIRLRVMLRNRKWTEFQGRVPKSALASPESLLDYYREVGRVAGS